MALLVFALPQAYASTAAGTLIENTVVVSYESTGGVSFSDTDSVTITISLVKQAPAVTFILQAPVATALDPTDENTSVTQTYSIYSNSNGSVLHTINQAVYAPTDIDPATNISAPSTVWLGATSLAYEANSGTDIYVPFDGTDDSEILTGDATAAGQGIAVNDYVIISGGTTPYQVTAIDEDTSGDPNLPVGLQGEFAKLTLDTGLTDSPGALITEYQKFDVILDTDVLTTGNTTGNYTGSLTATDGTNASGAATSDVYVARASLTVSKEVWDGTGWVDTLDAAPDSTLTYRITVENTTAKTSTAINITDALSPYIAFQSTGNPTFADDATNPSGLDYTTATITYEDQTGAAHTPTSGGGGAPAGFDADVAQFEIEFGSQVMDGNGKFTLTYDVKVY